MNQVGDCFDAKSRPQIDRSKRCFLVSWSRTALIVIVVGFVADRQNVNAQDAAATESTQHATQHAAQQAAQQATQEAPPAQRPQKTTIRLVIDFGDGVEKHFTALRSGPDATVWSLLEQAAKHPRGIKIKHRGRRDTLMVTEIDDVANEGAGRNWIFRVNEDLGERSAGIQPVKPGDAILWRFETYQ